MRSPARRGVGGARGPQAGQRDGDKAEPTDEVAGGGAGPTELDGGGAGGWRLALTEWRRRRGVLEAWGRRRRRGRTGGWGRGGAGGALGSGGGGALGGLAVWAAPRLEAGAWGLGRCSLGLGAVGWWAGPLGQK